MLDTVAPFAGAWIEIVRQVYEFEIPNVAPFTGAWIEIISSFLNEVEPAFAISVSIYCFFKLFLLQ